MYTYFESSDPWGKLNWQTGESFIELALSALILLYICIFLADFLSPHIRQRDYVPCRAVPYVTPL